MEIISSKQTAEHYTWGENCESWVLIKREGITVKHERIPSGAREQLQFQNAAQQFFFMLLVVATLHVEDNSYSISEQQSILVYPKTKHLIVNNGGSETEFLVVSQPLTDHDRVDVEQGGLTH